MLVKGSLNAQRLITAIQMQKPELVEPLSRELWMRIWSRDEDITTADSLKEAAKKTGLSDAEADYFVQQTKDKNVKERLKQVTDEALDAGGFGLPIIIVPDSTNTKHMIFGSDRMELIASILNEKYMGPLTELAQAKQV
jgi:glutathione S-transferase kappa 1